MTFTLQRILASVGCFSLLLGVSCASQAQNTTQGETLDRIQNLENLNRELTNRIEQLERNMQLIQTAKPDETTEPSKEKNNAETVGSIKPEALYEKGLAQVRSGAYEESESTFKNFIATFKNHKLIPNAYYWLGESFFARNQYGEAASHFVKLYSDYPEAAKTPDALLKLAFSLVAENEKPSACTALNTLITKYPNATKQVKNMASETQKQNNC